MTTPLEDSDSMPFGKYKGESMDSIPASYLHWLWTNGKKHECKTCPVAGYIKNNIEALKLEYKDGLWT